ncbi:MAG TPA: M13 family metallopeptidase [Thermoanaerobaculia bacterium]|nr:M13 family metallopeptidase [Thermoanaerobaculia bacterium]
MRIAALCTLLLTLTAVAQERGVFVEDLDRTADACTNFFDYANGAWRKANPIPASQSRWSRRWASGELSKEQLRAILDEVSAKRDWPKGSIDQQIGDFYGSCMDAERINAQGIKPIQPVLDRIAAIDSHDELQQVIADLHELQVPVLFGVGATPDTRNPSSNVIAQVSASGIGMFDRDYYIRPEPRFAEAREKYREHLAKMFELTGTPRAQAKRDAATVFELETRLAKWQFDNVQLRNPRLTDHKHYVATLQAMTPHFDWKRYLAEAEIAPQELNVDQPLFMQAVDRELARTPLSAWRTYLRWHVLNATAPYLTDAIAKQDWTFYGQYLNGAKEMKPRWKLCVETTDRLLGEAVGQRYVERYFTAEAKSRMQEMVKNLLAAMGDTIRGLDWMGAQTKQQALEKLATFNPKVGYPDKWIDYSSIDVSRGGYMQNVINATRFATSYDRVQVGKPIDRGRWGMTPPTSNAYYNPLLNEIVFPAGILQPPAFDVKATDAVNYGAIGVVIGHEISHGFDDQGSQFDARGRLRNWWTEQDLARFTEKGQCVVDQFESYFVEPGIHHNGKLVLGESIGDLAGARIAYLAFQKAQQARPAKTIDGFTPDQQFFIGWGQFRGDEIRPEAQRTMVQRDPHPIGKYRVMGPLSNMPEFATAFGCKAGAEMVRAKKCEVW